MPFFSKQTLKNLASTQLLSTGLSVESLVKPAVLSELKKKFGKDHKIYASSITFRIILPDKRITTIVLEHQSEESQKKKITAITSDNATTLKKFIK